MRFIFADSADIILDNFEVLPGMWEDRNKFVIGSLENALGCIAGTIDDLNVFHCCLISMMLECILDSMYQ